MSVFQGKNLSYGTILANATLSLNFGELHGLIGPNGSGKTTLLKALAGLLPLDKGSLYWKGQEITQYERIKLSQYISFVPHNPQIHFDFSVEHMVSMGCYAQKKERTKEALEEVEMSSFAHRSILTLSSGERQLVYIARSLAANTPIILLDEPTANLDLHHQVLIWKLLHKMVDQKKIVLLSIHDIRAAKKEIDTFFLMADGQLVQEGSFEKVISPKTLRKVFYIDSLTI